MKKIVNCIENGCNGPTLLQCIHSLLTPVSNCISYFTYRRLSSFFYQTLRIQLLLSVLKPSMGQLIKVWPQETYLGHHQMLWIILENRL